MKLYIDQMFNTQGGGFGRIVWNEHINHWKVNEMKEENRFELIIYY